MAVASVESLKKGDRVWALWGSVWKTAEVVEVLPDGAKIFFDGDVAAFDEIYPAWKIRLMETPKAPVASRPTTSLSPNKEAQKQTPVARQWSDSSGAFKIQATFVATEGDKVHLRKTDGTTLAVPLERLSADDKEYVKQQSL